MIYRNQYIVDMGGWIQLVLIDVSCGADAHRVCILHHVADIERLTAAIAEVEAKLAAKCHEIPNAEKILAICGLGETITSGILAEMGDIDRYDDAKEIQKLSGLGLVACSSGKHKGQTKISHRGRCNRRPPGGGNCRWFIRPL